MSHNVQEPLSPLSSSIQVSSALVPPTPYEQWNVILSCHAEFQTFTPEEKERLGNVTKMTDAIIHILPYPDVLKKDDSTFSTLSKVIINNDCKLQMYTTVR